MPHYEYAFPTPEGEEDKRKKLREAGRVRREGQVFHSARSKIAQFLKGSLRTIGDASLPGVLLNLSQGDTEGLNRARSVAEGLTGVPKSLAASLIERLPSGGIGPGFVSLPARPDSKTPEDVAGDVRDFRTTGFLDRSLGEEIDPSSELLGRVAGEIGVTITGGRAIGAIPLVARIPQKIRLAVQFAPVGFLFGLDKESSAVQAGAELLSPEAGEFAERHPYLRALAEMGAFAAVDVGIETLMAARAAKTITRAETAALERQATAKAFEAEGPARKVLDPDPVFHEGEQLDVFEREAQRMADEVGLDIEDTRDIVNAGRFSDKMDADFVADVADELKVLDGAPGRVEFLDLVNRRVEDVMSVTDKGLAGSRLSAFFEVAVEKGMDAQFAYHRFLVDLSESGRADLKEALHRLQASSEATAEQMGQALERAGKNALGDDLLEDLLKDAGRELEGMGLDTAKGGFVDVRTGLPEGVHDFSTRPVSRQVPGTPDLEGVEFAGRMVDTKNGSLVPVEGVYDANARTIFVKNMGDEFAIEGTEAAHRLGSRNIRKGIRFLKEQFPESEHIAFVRDGSTGGEAGRIVSLRIKVAEEGGFAADALLRAITRTTVGALAGGALGSQFEDVGFFKGFGLAAGASLAGPPGVRALKNIMTSSSRRAARVALEDLVESETRAINSLIDQGELFPEQFNPVADKMLMSTPKELDVEKVMQRGRRRIDASQSEAANYITEDIVGKLDLEQQLDARVFTNDDLVRAAKAAGFEPKVLEEAIATAGKTRTQGMRATLEYQARIDEMIVADEIILRAKGRVDKEAFEKLLGYRALLSEEASSIMQKQLNYGSEVGRSLQALKQEAMAEATFTPNRVAIWALQAERLSGKSLRPGDLAEIQSILRAGDRKAMRLFMAKMNTRRMNFGEKFAGFVRAGLLTGPHTDALNISSTLMHMSMRNISNPGATVLDRIVTAILPGAERTVALNVFTGAAVQRAGWKLKAGEGLMLGMEGAQRGNVIIRGARDIWNNKADVRAAFVKIDYTAIVTGNPIVDGYLQLPVRLGAEDAIMKGIAFHTSVHERAKVMVLNSGLKPRDAGFQEAVLKIIADMPDEITIPAVLDAAIATYTNVTKLGRHIISFKKMMTEAGTLPAIVAGLGVPFVNTLINVGHALFKLSVLGLVTPSNATNMMRFARHLASRGANPMTKEAQRALVTSLSQAGTMGGALMVFGAYLRANGMMTGRYDKDPGLFRATRRQPLAININKWSISLENLTPAGNILALGGMIWDVAINPENDQKPLLNRTAAVASGAFASYMSQISELTFLANVDNILAAMTGPERGLNTVIKGFGRMLVPTIVRDVAVSVDPTLRQQDNFLQAFASGVPGVSMLLEPKIGVLGDVRTRAGIGEGLGGRLAEKILSPVRLGRLTTDEVYLALSKLGVQIPVLQAVSRRGISGRLRTILEVEYGKDLRGVLESKLQDPNFRKKGIFEKRDILKRLAASTRSKYTKMLSDRGILLSDEELYVPDPHFSKLDVDIGNEAYVPAFEPRDGGYNYAFPE